MQKLQNKQSTNTKAGVSVTQTSIYSGKLPSPEMMQQYNQVDTDFANRILTMAEKEEKHVHKIENRQLNIAVMMAIFGVISGLIALGTLCFLLYLSIEKGNTNVALGIVGIIGTVVAIFVLNKKKQ